MSSDNEEKVIVDKIEEPKNVVEKEELYKLISAAVDSSQTIHKEELSQLISTTIDSSQNKLIEKINSSINNAFTEQIYPKFQHYDQVIETVTQKIYTGNINFGMIENSIKMPMTQVMLTIKQSQN